jgi:hypothetical protein
MNELIVEPVDHRRQCILYKARSHVNLGHSQGDRGRLPTAFAEREAETKGCYSNRQTKEGRAIHPRLLGVSTSDIAELG